MDSYKQVVETAEFALIKGEYSFCIEYLYPIIESYPPSSKEGVNLRTIMITALSGINKKEEAKIFCKELLKSHDFKVRDNAKYLMEIIDSPEIKKPDNWNITIESNSNLNKTSLTSIKPNKNKKEKKFINISNIPTGETKPFQKGFLFIISFLLLLLIPLLSGCVKIDDTLDLSEIDSINNSFEIESKYIKKFPWQINFEQKVKEIFPDAEISEGNLDFSFTNKNLNIETAQETLYKIEKTASTLLGESTDLKINSVENNFFFFKKYIYSIDFDLHNLLYVDDLELTLNIINPNRVRVRDLDENKVELSKNFIKWQLIPGELNSLEFTFWIWNKLFLGFLLILVSILLTYLIRFYRYQIGSNFPELPSN
ncbi:conserved hypothetical protein [Prochlorococcus marinus str. MIT 9515]|uniref:DUF3153 domain-containing protein n=1 Tax=Prochlorococcus marinus (strain MIT 9515) TaxID=167542 RepID=A2BVG0_PROM5|nr:DUF3153 domain-containing protein [Prochlorococcus marinus]ABM71771.1 conserved hypothetical protein [Prochlorococcus marinus str. MIT 9515]